MDLQIRKANRWDLDLLAAMNLRLIRDERHRNPMGPRALRRRMALWLRGEYRAILFLSRRVCVGYCLYCREGDHWNLRQFFIERGHRRKGLGRAAFLRMKRTLWGNPPRIRVEALAGNRRALAFWRTLGFKDYARSMERVS